VRLLIIDTIRASMTGSEDSSEHVSAYLRAVRRLLAIVPGSAAILAHHSGWQDGDTQRKRERGSSAWRGNSDGTLYLELADYDEQRREARLILKTLKVRDGERPAPLHLLRRQVYLDELDRHGHPLTSCVVELDRRSREEREADQTSATDAEARALDVQILRAIAERPDLATSQDRLRMLLNIRKTLIGESLGRLVRQQWIAPGRRNQPFTLTDAGRLALEQP
jgi:hypothetical protein